jgi:hypothetical protein
VLFSHPTVLRPAFRELNNEWTFFIAPFDTEGSVNIATMPIETFRVLVEKYGENVILELLRRKEERKKFNDFELVEMRKMYKQKIDKLKEV